MSFPPAVRTEPITVPTAAAALEQECMSDFKSELSVHAFIRLPIDSVSPSPHHARLHNQKKRRKLEKLLKKFGQVTPIVVDPDHVIIDGHAVFEVLKGLGCHDVMAIVVANGNAIDKRALSLALNRIVNDAKWDEERLRTEFRELVTLGFDLELTAFEQVEIDMVLDIDPVAPGDVEEEEGSSLEPGSVPPVVTAGDIFRAGRHEIGCGDARNHHLLTSLIVGRSAPVVFTDPPYNVKIAGFVSGLGRKRHRDFEMASGEMTKREFVDFLAALIPHLTDGAILYLCIDWRHMAELLEAAWHNELTLKNLCVWCKTNAGNGTFCRSQHELVFVFKHGNGQHQNHFELGQYGRLRSNVWTYAGVNTFGKNRMELLGVHPTVKPWKMIADALRDVSRQRDIVIDPFLGSGSTLIAAEETGRTCVGIDVDPAYVEVAIRRWQKHTGHDAIHVLTGLTFDEYVERMRAECTAEKPAADARVDGDGQADGAASDSRG
jgi:DNA modification methylase